MMQQSIVRVGILLWHIVLVGVVDALANPPPPSTRRQESLELGHNPLLSLNLNLDALTRAQATDRAQELYSRIYALHEEGYYATAPDIVSFNTVLKGFAQDPAAAMEFWVKELNASPEREKPLRPNTRSYNTILLALARAGLHAECLEILRQMQDPTTNVWPDRITYNIVLLSYASSRNDDGDDNDQAPMLAEALLQEMIDQSQEIDSQTGMAQGIAPDVVAYNTVLTCFAQQGDAARAQAWLDRMNESSKGVALLVSSNRQQHSVKPDVYSYTTVMQAWAQQGEVDKALALLDEMKAQPSTRSFPNKISYTALVEALTQQGRMSDAHDLVARMWESSVDTQPDAVTYSVLLKGWAAVAPEQPEEAMRAVDRILSEMSQRATSNKNNNNPEVAPNAVTWANALRVLAQAKHWDAPAQAQKIVRRIPPESMTVVLYNAWLGVHAKSPRADKAIQCAIIWKEMQKHRIVPDHITYNTILMAAANAYGNAELRQKSLEVGLLAFDVFTRGDEHKPSKDEEIRNNNNLPTSLTFSFFIHMLRKCGGSLSSSECQKLLRKGLAACGPRYKCLNAHVWDQFIKATQQANGRRETDPLGLASLGIQTDQNRFPNFDTLPATWSERAMKSKARYSRK